MHHPLESKLKRTQETFDALAKKRLSWKKRNRYYHNQLIRFYRFLIPEGYRVLEIGSGDGDLLAALKPSKGVGIDASSEFVAIAKERYPQLQFLQGFAEKLELTEKFDFVILSELVGHLEDVQIALERLHQVCTPSTRILVNYYNYLWEPVLTLGSWTGLRMKQKIQNWLSLEDLENLLQISGFDVVKKTPKLIFPIDIPLVSAFLNRVVANLPFFRQLCLLGFIIARPAPKKDGSNPSVSVVIPARNEKGNIEDLVKRLPDFPGGLEMIFVEGHSTDGTREEILRVQKLYPVKNIRLVDQGQKKGKGSAMRVGFAEAKNDILIILDSDISVAPEDTPKFYRLLVSHTGEFINGTRMVYPMEKQAMRFLNILGNKFFSMAFTFLLEQRIKDTLCGTKAFYRSDYEQIAKNRSYFGDFDPFGDFDLLFGAAKLNLKIVEVPVRYYERQYGSTKIHRFRHGLLLLGMCGIALKKLKFAN